MKDNLLSLVCLIFICGYVFAAQYFFSITHPHYVVDFGQYYLYENGFYPEFQEDPSGYVRTRFLAFFAPRENQWFGELSWKKTPFHLWILSVCFLLFGKTLFVYKMSMVWAVWGMALAAYCLLYRYTRSAIIGLSGTMLLLATPNIAVFSRTSYSFIPMACFVLWAVYVYGRYLEKPQWQSVAAFCVIFVVACWTHYSAFLYFLILGAYLYREKRDRLAALSFTALYALCGWFYLRGDMTIGFFRHFHRLDIPLEWREFPRTAIGLGKSLFTRPLSELFGGVMDQFGVFFFVGVAFALIRYVWRREKTPDRAMAEGGLPRFMVVFMGSLFVCAALIGIVQIENYSPFYSMGVILLSMSLWGGTLPGGWVRRCSQACLVIVALGSLSRIPAVDESWLGRRMTVDLSQLFHYMKTTRTTDPHVPFRVVTLFAGKVPANDEAMKIRRSLIDVPAFYDGIDLEERSTWCQVGTAPMPPEVSGRVKESDYVFVFLRRRDGPKVSLMEEKERVRVFLRGRGLFQCPDDSFRYLVSYEVGPNHWLIVLRRHSG
ncbi:MAG TPA: glycosyltransferase family 39 protein [Elusimicrobiota bacterium]|nr:glycosyltransferase family 39 protein [Elusimicrobiota bacterium]